MSNSKTYRIKGDLVKQIKKRTMNYIIDEKEIINEAEMTNALILKGLESIENENIKRYLHLTETKQIK